MTDDHTTLLEPEDIHIALAGPGIAGADGVLVYEDGVAQKGEPLHDATQRMIDTVFGPTATELYGSRPGYSPGAKSDDELHPAVPKVAAAAAAAAARYSSVAAVTARRHLQQHQAINTGDAATDPAGSEDEGHWYSWWMLVLAAGILFVCYWCKLDFDRIIAERQRASAAEEIALFLDNELGHEISDTAVTAVCDALAKTVPPLDPEDWVSTLAALDAQELEGLMQSVEAEIAPESIWAATPEGDGSGGAAASTSTSNPSAGCYGEYVRASNQHKHKHSPKQKSGLVGAFLPCFRPSFDRHQF